jgi:hypothetical protein
MGSTSILIKEPQWATLQLVGGVKFTPGMRLRINEGLKTYVKQVDDYRKAWARPAIGKKGAKTKTAAIARFALQLRKALTPSEGAAEVGGQVFNFNRIVVEGIGTKPDHDFAIATTVNHSFMDESELIRLVNLLDKLRVGAMYAAKKLEPQDISSTPLQYPG